MRLALASLLAFAFGLSAAPIPKPKEKPKDEEAILGTWQVEKFDFGPGVPAPPLDFTQMQFAFATEGRMTMTIGALPPKTSVFKLDPAAKLKTIDVSESGRVAPGIYELDGDTLKLCIADGKDAARPMEMKAEGGRTIVVMLKRVKEEKKDN